MAAGGDEAGGARSKLRGTEAEGVFFTEEPHRGQVLKHVAVRINRQNANLTEVKRRMAAEATAAGANAIVNFRYGQRSHKWWQLLLPRWDTESWYGEGDAVVL